MHLYTESQEVQVFLDGTFYLFSACTDAHSVYAKAGVEYSPRLCLKLCQASPGI